jgi:hypothetical protein
MIKITQVANQYILNNNGLVVVFETAEKSMGIMLVLKRKLNFFDNNGNNLSKSAGVCTLIDDAMKKALEEMHSLGINVIEKD